MVAARRVHALIRGRVQGVFYRASTEERATALGLAGWVKNRRDGAVELEAEGSPEAVDALLAWCRTGPPAARVEAVEVDEQAVRGDERGFRVDR